MDWVMELEKALSFEGRVAESSARSTTERVVPWPGVRFAQVCTKSSTMRRPSSRVGMEVFLLRAVSQFV